MKDASIGFILFFSFKEMNKFMNKSCFKYTVPFLYCRSRPSLYMQTTQLVGVDLLMGEVEQEVYGLILLNLNARFH